jgi:hypothetical protein
MSISGLILAGIFFVLLLLTIFYEPAKRKTTKISIYATISLVVWWFLITGIGVFFVVE